MNDIRRKVIRQVKDSKFNLYSYVHPTSVIASNSIIGEGNIILEKCIVQPYVVIGEGNIFWSNVNVSHHDLIGDFNYFSPSVSLSGNVTIHNNCFFGNNCVIRKGIF
jgi:UDP-3-O-[3-hydroxymyristoyl] glucosamine N-acyltransferase